MSVHAERSRGIHAFENDVYTIGAMIFRLLTGCNLCDVADVSEALEASIGIVPNDPMQHLILRCTQEDPSDRPLLQDLAKEIRSDSIWMRCCPLLVPLLRTIANHDTKIQFENSASGVDRTSLYSEMLNTDFHYPPGTSRV